MKFTPAVLFLSCHFDKSVAEPVVEEWEGTEFDLKQAMSFSPTIHEIPCDPPLVQYQRSARVWKPSTINWVKLQFGESTEEQVCQEHPYTESCANAGGKFWRHELGYSGSGYWDDGYYANSGLTAVGSPAANLSNESVTFQDAQTGYVCCSRQAATTNYGVVPGFLVCGCLAPDVENLATDEGATCCSNKKVDNICKCIEPGKTNQPGLQAGQNRLHLVPSHCCFPDEIHIPDGFPEDQNSVCPPRKCAHYHELPNGVDKKNLL